MDLGDAHQRSRVGEEGIVEESTYLNEIGSEINGSYGDSGVGRFDPERSAIVGENSEVNGCGDGGRKKIVNLAEMNGEMGGGEKEIDSNVDSSGRMGKSGDNVSSIHVGTVDSGSNGKGVEKDNKVGTPTRDIGSPPGESGASTTPKGYGLKKWRRIKRDAAKDGTSVTDPNRILKRGLSNSEPPRIRDLPVENKPKSEVSGSGSVASLNSPGRTMVFSALPVVLPDSDSRLAVGTAFAIGAADSDNSEDRCSKSSTAASAPKSRLEMLGNLKEKSKVKSTGSRSSGGGSHRTQQSKGKVDSTKKHRGERVKVEKENSHSSVESDLRSSNVIFMETGAFASMINGRQMEASSNYDGETSDGVQLNELASSKEAGADSYKQNGDEVEVVSRDGVGGDVPWLEKNDESVKQGPSADHDPLVESIFLLQVAQEALEKELQYIADIGKEPISMPSSVSFGVSSSAHLPPEEIEECNSEPREAELTKLREKVSHLEHELEKSSAALKAKESQLSELQSILNNTQTSNGTWDDLASIQEMGKEMEIELDNLLKKKLEVEVECLMMVRQTQDLKLMAAEAPVSLLEQKKSLTENQEQMLVRLRDAEDKLTALERHAEDLETSSHELLETKKVLKMQNDVWKFTLCCFTQLILLCVAFAFFILQLLPLSSDVVPT